MAWDRYVNPFNYGLWLAVAITACVVGVCLALSKYGHKRNQSLSVSGIFFYIHACFCQQGQSYKFAFAFLDSTIFVTLYINFISLSSARIIISNEVNVSFSIFISIQDEDW